MKQALIQPDKQTAVLRDYKAFEDDTALKRGGMRKTQKELDEDTTEFLWTNTPHINDGRVALWVEDTDDPRLTTEAEKAAMISEEEARAQGFCDPVIPANVEPPTLTYTSAWPGLAVSCISGEWTGAPAPEFFYQWQADGVDILQAITSVHTVTIADVGKVLTCVVTGRNSVGEAAATSNECTTVAVKTGGARAAAPAKKAALPPKKTAHQPARKETKSMRKVKKPEPKLPARKVSAKKAVKKTYRAKKK